MRVGDRLDIDFGQVGDNLKILGTFSVRWCPHFSILKMQDSRAREFIKWIPFNGNQAEYLLSVCLRITTECCLQCSHDILLKIQFRNVNAYKSKLNTW